MYRLSEYNMILRSLCCVQSDYRLHLHQLLLLPGTGGPHRPLLLLPVAVPGGGVLLLDPGQLAPQSAQFPPGQPEIRSQPQLALPQPLHLQVALHTVHSAVGHLALGGNVVLQQLQLVRLQLGHLHRAVRTAAQSPAAPPAAGPPAPAGRPGPAQPRPAQSCRVDSAGVES